MDHKKVSRVLLAAGALAAAGGGFLFFVYGPLAARECRADYPELAHLYGPGLIYVLVIGLLYALAMGEYFRIVRRIGQDRSFCRENARDLSGIALFMLLAAGIWIVGMALLLLIWQAPVGPAGMLAVILAAAASAAMGVLAWGLGQLLARAVRLKEENDLTV